MDLTSVEIFLLTKVCIEVKMASVVMDFSPKCSGKKGLKKILLHLEEQKKENNI